MLEAAYRPNGWLGIMLGSRLYYEFTEAALSNVAEWERVADGVSQEVRRHGAPPPSSEAAAKAVDVAVVVAPAAPGVPARKAAAVVGSLPLRDVAAGVSVSSVVHNSNATRYSNNNNSISNSISNNSNNSVTSIVLL